MGILVPAHTSSHCGPVLGPPGAPHFEFELRDAFLHLFDEKCYTPQALAVWQWFNACGARVAEGRSVLRMNLDETSLCLYQGDVKGTIFGSRKRGPGELVQKVSVGKRRCCLTHVGLICDRPYLQPLLPQFIVGNEATFKERDMRLLRAACPTNVHIVRQRSAWNNAELMMCIIRRIAVVLQPYAAELQPVLLFDASRIHLATDVLRCCLAAGIWPIVVPARMTWLMQPLDTHCFRMFKLLLGKAAQGARGDTADGQLSVAGFLSCVCHAIRHGLQGHAWAHAFDSDGFGGQQAGLSAYAQHVLGLGGAVRVPDSPPTEELVAMCLPRRARVPIHVLLRPFLPPRVSPSLRLHVGMRESATPLPFDAAQRASSEQRRTAAEHADTDRARMSGMAVACPLSRWQARRMALARGGSASSSPSGT